MVIRPLLELEVDASVARIDRLLVLVTERGLRETEREESVTVGEFRQVDAVADAVPVVQSAHLQVLAEQFDDISVFAGSETTVV